MSSNPDVSTDRRLLKIPAGVGISSGQVVNETNENPSADASYTVGTNSLRWTEAHAIDFFSERAAGDFFPVTRLGWDNLTGFGALQMGPGGATPPDVYLGRFVANALSPVGDQITSLGDSLRSFKNLYASKIANNGIAMQAGSTTATTDGSANFTVTFPQSFGSTPTAVTAIVNGANYACRIVSKSTTQAVFRIFQPSVSVSAGLAVTGVSATTGSALTSVTDVNSGSFKVFTSSSAMWAAAISGGTTTTQFEAIAAGGAVTIVPVTGHTSNSGTFVTGVSTSQGSFLTNVFVGFDGGIVNTSVTVDWIAVA